MKRRLLIIAICLLLGAVVNLAVAWGICSRSEWQLAIGGQPLSEVSWIVGSGGTVPDGATEQHRYAFGEESRWYFDRHAGNGSQLTSNIFAIYAWTGWPLRCFRGGWWFDYESNTANYVDSVQLPHRLGIAGPWGEPFLPKGVVWPGFAVNTICYATILWLLIRCPFALRRILRLLRLRRGLCPKCAYPMGEAAVCTECGRQLPKRVTPWARWARLQPAPKTRHPVGAPPRQRS